MPLRYFTDTGIEVPAVRFDPKELIILPRITLEQAANFGLAKVKEFLG